MSYISEKNNIMIEIKQVQNFIKRSEDTIKRLKQQEKTDFNSSQIKKLESSISEYTMKAEALNIKYDKLCKGEYIPEIKTIPTVKKTPELKDKISQKPKQVETKYKYEYDSREFSSNFLQKQTQKFTDLCSTIPDYMSENLKNMPQNRGYLWKGVAFYGDKTSEGNIITLFEKRNGVMKIHEWAKNTYSIYEKIDKGQKKLLFQKERHKL